MSPILFFHADVFATSACLKHSNFLTVNVPNTAPVFGKDAQGHSDAHPEKRTDCPRQKSNYELFNRNNFKKRYWSWNYRGCWHQTCPPIDTRKEIKILLIPITRHGCPVLLFLVITSLCQDLVIYAPAAFLRSGSRFSGPLSRIEPQFSVTRQCHGRPIPYHRKLIGQKIERLVAKSDQYFIMNHQEHNRSWKVWNLINTTLHKSGLYACISSRINKGIQK